LKFIYSKNFFDLTLKSIEKGKNKGFDLNKKIY